MSSNKSNKTKKSEIPKGRSPMPVGGKVKTKLPKKKKEKDPPPVVPVPLGKPKVKDPQPLPKEQAPKRMPSDLIDAMIDAKYECLAKIVQDHIVAFTQSKEYMNHKGMKKHTIDFYKEAKMSGDDPKLLFWTNAIPAKKGNWNKFKDGKDSGYVALKEFLTSRGKETNLLFYTAARRLEECKAKPSKYYQHFNALCKDFLDDTANDGRVPASIGRKTLRKLEPYFVPHQLIDDMNRTKKEIYGLVQANFWFGFKEHLRSKQKEENFVENISTGEIFDFLWVKKVPAEFLPKKGSTSGPTAYWMDAILLEKDGGYDAGNFEKNLKKSGFCKFMEYLEVSLASENLLFYARARELEQYYLNDREAYLTKFAAVFLDFVGNETGRIATLNISSTDKSKLKASYRRFCV